MTAFEYRVVPAPRRGQKERGLKTAEDRYANALQGTINEMGAKGWEYLRAETLPCEERQGLGGRKTVYHSVLVFRRATAQAGPARCIQASAPALFRSHSFTTPDFSSLRSPSGSALAGRARLGLGAAPRTTPTSQSCGRRSTSDDDSSKPEGGGCQAGARYASSTVS